MCEKCFSELGRVRKAAIARGEVIAFKLPRARYLEVLDSYEREEQRRSEAI
jgi:hypothetical protein